MTQQEKNKAIRKADLALSKLQDIFYLNITDSIATRLNQSCDDVRDLMNKIEAATPKK